MSLATCW
ncbi:hypothetical protein VCHENC02_5690A, partial [Vibrio harveyi]